MKRNGIVVVWGLAMTLAATGAFGADVYVAHEGSSMMFASTPVDLEQYQSMAVANAPRCVDAISWSEGMYELEFALANNLITREAYDWGVSHHYYPILDRYLRVRAVCSF